MRFVGNLAIAIVLFGMVLAILLVGFGAAYLPLWETEAVDKQGADGAWLDVDGRPIFYRTWGSQDDHAIVLVHGHAVEASAIWQEMAPTLADEGLRVIAVDLLGYGHSYRETAPVYTLRTQASVLAHVLNQLRVNGATIVGYQQGAAVALQLAVEQPQFVGGLVLIAPDLEPAPGALWRAMARAPHAGRALAWAFCSGGPFWSWEQSRVAEESALAPEQYLASVSDVTRIPGTAEALRMMALSTADDNLPEALPGLGMPALVLCGTQDGTCTRSGSETLAGIMPDARVVELSQASVPPPLDQLDRMTTAIAEFAESQDRGSP